VEVYYYIPANEVSFAVECGLKLSTWYDKEVPIHGENKKCMSALLNPKDDMEKYKSTDLKCLKLEVPPNYCYVADKSLYEAGLTNDYVMGMYLDSITYAQGYMFGSYRMPECLVTSTIIGGSIGVLDKRIDSPVIVDSSEELYINNTIEKHRETYYDFNDTMLYYFYCKLVENGRFEKIEGEKQKIAVFVDKEFGKVYTVKIPNMEKYITG